MDTSQTLDVLQAEISQYKYQPIVGDRFRLLHLYTDKWESALQGELIESPIEDAPMYFCVSYTWGLFPKDWTILLGGDSLAITQNLYGGLRHIRSMIGHHSIFIWADAICINQGDLAERSSQVQLMGRVFSGSQQVFAYLGEDPGNDQDLCPLLSKINSLWHTLYTPGPRQAAKQVGPEDYERLGLPPADDKAWQKFVEFIELAWFTRAWIVQEVLLAKSLVLSYGELWMPYEIFETVMACIHRHFEHFRANTHFSDSAALCLFDLRFKAVGSARDQWLRPRRRLIDWLDLVDHVRASNPRDYIISLLGLSTDQDEPQLLPKYECPVEETYRDFAASYISRGNGIKVLYLASKYGAAENTASWVPDISDRNQLYDILLPKFLIDEGNPITYASAGGPESSLSLRPDGRLSCRFVPVGAVSTLGGVCINSIFQSSKHHEISGDSKIINPIPSTKKHLSYKIRTALAFLIEARKTLRAVKPALVDADLAPSLAKIVFYDRKVGYQSEMTENEIGSVRALLELYDIDESEDTVSDLLRTARLAYDTINTTSLLRRLALVEEKYVCRVPNKSVVGDRVGAILGGAIPFVLRPIGGGFQLVGTCYVHGFMKGEALVPGRFEARDVEIV